MTRSPNNKAPPPSSSTGVDEEEDAPSRPAQRPPPVERHGAGLHAAGHPSTPDPRLRNNPTTTGTRVGTTTTTTTTGATKGTTSNGNLATTAAFGVNVQEAGRKNGSDHDSHARQLGNVDEEGKRNDDNSKPTPMAATATTHGMVFNATKNATNGNFPTAPAAAETTGGNVEKVGKKNDNNDDSHKQQQVTLGVLGKTPAAIMTQEIASNSTNHSTNGNFATTAAFGENIGKVGKKNDNNDDNHKQQQQVTLGAPSKPTPTATTTQRIVFNSTKNSTNGNFATTTALGGNVEKMGKKNDNKDEQKQKHVTLGVTAHEMAWDVSRHYSSRKEEDETAVVGLQKALESFRSDIFAMRDAEKMAAASFGEIATRVESVIRCRLVDNNLLDVCRTILGSIIPVRNEELRNAAATASRLLELRRKFVQAKPLVKQLCGRLLAKDKYNAYHSFVRTQAKELFGFLNSLRDDLSDVPANWVALARQHVLMNDEQDAQSVSGNRYGDGGMSDDDSNGADNSDINSNTKTREGRDVVQQIKEMIDAFLYAPKKRVRDDLEQLGDDAFRLTTEPRRVVVSTSFTLLMRLLLAVLSCGRGRALPFGRFAVALTGRDDDHVGRQNKKVIKKLMYHHSKEVDLSEDIRLRVLKYESKKVALRQVLVDIQRHLSIYNDSKLQELGEEIAHSSLFLPR